jgi:sugar phosphate isomerase/epimerase
MQAAGLRCVSAHYPYTELDKNLDRILTFHKEAGIHSIICSFPGFKEAEHSKGLSYEQQVKAFTLEDFRWNAEQFNRIGKVVRDAGMQFGYHNHTMEFAAQSGVVPFDELLRLTDPALVTIEMDCGWVVVGGADPAEYLRRYPARISMLHVKDFKRTERPLPVGEAPPAAELGRGTLDYSSIFRAARQSNIQHYFVEQESFDIPPMDALRIDADYMKALKV